MEVYHLYYSQGTTRISNIKNIIQLLSLLTIKSSISYSTPFTQVHWNIIILFGQVKLSSSSALPSLRRASAIAYKQASTEGRLGIITKSVYEHNY